MTTSEPAYVGQTGPLNDDSDIRKVTDTTDMLRSLDADIPHLEAVLRQLRLQEQDTETQETERAKTPLSLQLSLMSCEFATMTYGAEMTIPDYQFQAHPCIYGKTRPDQDCRPCNHVQILPYGGHLPPHERRYARHGMVIPIADEAQAESLAKMVDALGMKPLRRISLEISMVERALSNAHAQRATLTQG